jgi:hypothetical protein
MKHLLFCLLSLADLSMTCWLLGNSGGQTYEANPLARWWLSRHGWLGLAGFKLACVLAVLGLAAVISRHRPRAGTRVLTFGCAALAAVVLYSAALCLNAHASPERQQAEESRRLDGELRKVEVYHALVKRLAEDVVAGRLTLREATRLIAESERGQDPAWLECLASAYPGRSVPECLAANIILHAGVSQGEQTPAACEVALRLEREFYLNFGTPAPLRHQERQSRTQLAPAAAVALGQPRSQGWRNRSGRPRVPRGWAP